MLEKENIEINEKENISIVVHRIYAKHPLGAGTTVKELCTIALNVCLNHSIRVWEITASDFYHLRVCVPREEDS